MNSLTTFERNSAFAPQQTGRITFGGQPVVESETESVAVADDIRRIFNPLAPSMSPLVRNESYTEIIPGFWGNRTETRSREVTRSPSELFEEFNEKYKHIEQFREATADWMCTAVAANVEFRNVAGQDPTQLLGGREKLMGQFLKPLLWRSLTELAIKPLDEQLQGLSQWLTDGFCGVVQSMSDALNGFCGQEMLGRLFRHPNRVCELSYYRWIVEETITNVQRGPKTKGIENISDHFFREVTTVHGRKDVRRELKHQFHQHVLLKSEFLPWNTTSIPIPARMRPVLTKTPQPMRSLVEIVVGDEIGRRILEREVFSETRTENFTEVSSRVVQRPVYVRRDPGIVFARSIVLCGWSPEEV